MIETKVARDARNAKNAMRRLSRSMRRNVKRTRKATQPTPSQRPGWKFVADTNDYLVWSRQIAAFAKGELVAPNMREWAQWRKSLSDNATNVRPIWTHTDNRVVDETVEAPSYRPVWEKIDGKWVITGKTLEKFSPVTIDDFGRKRPATEVVESESIQPVNYDIPDDKYLADMGCGLRKNESLDFRNMDDRDFRERCVVVGGRLYALYEKRKPDLQPRSDLRQEVVAKMLGGDKRYADVDRFVKFCRSIKASRRVVLGMIFGYVRRDDDGKLFKTDGLKSTSADEFAEIVTEFEGIDSELKEYDIPEPETNRPRTKDDERVYWFGVAQKLWDRGEFVSVLSQIRFIEQSASRDVACGYYEDPTATPDSFVIYRTEDVIAQERLSIDDDEIVAEWNDDDEMAALSIENNPFGAHPLYDETSAISDEWIDEIRSASWKELRDMKAELMSSRLWYLNTTQRQMAWAYVKAREERLIVESLKRPTARWVAAYVVSNPPKQSMAMLFAWRDGERFDTDEMNFRFDEERATENELAAAWAMFRRSHKSHQKAIYRDQAKKDYVKHAYRDRRPGEKGPARIAVTRQS